MAIVSLDVGWRDGARHDDLTRVGAISRIEEDTTYSIPLHLILDKHKEAVIPVAIRVLPDRATEDVFAFVYDPPSPRIVAARLLRGIGHFVRQLPGGHSSGSVEGCGDEGEARDRRKSRLRGRAPTPERACLLIGTPHHQGSSGPTIYMVSYICKCYCNFVCIALLT